MTIVILSHANWKLTGFAELNKSCEHMSTNLAQILHCHDMIPVTDLFASGTRKHQYLHKWGGPFLAVADS